MKCRKNLILGFEDVDVLRHEENALNHVTLIIIDSDDAKRIINEINNFTNYNAAYVNYRLVTTIPSEYFGYDKATKILTFMLPI